MKQLFVLFLLSSILFSSLKCSFQESLFSEMNKNYNGENLIISPLSIFQALSLSANSAKGLTQEEMISVLGCKDIEELNQINYDILEIFKEFSTVEIANAVMTRFTPLQEFSEIAENYLAPTTKLESLKQVNDWCSEKTHGKINKILDKLDDNVLLLILNAVYFKGEWSVKFNKDITTKKPFYNLGLDENEISIDTMKKQNSYNYYENNELQAVELGYKKDSMSAVIILPSEKTKINDFINKINSENNLSSIISKLSRAKVYLELPKFELEFSVSLKKILQDMGMNKAFTNDADFTGLRKEGEIKIDDVLHKTYLKVNEDGTEAAAVTAVVNVATSAGPSKEIIHDMIVNRPFLFILRSKLLPPENDILFISKIENIKESK